MRVDDGREGGREEAGQLELHVGGRRRPPRLGVDPRSPDDRHQQLVRHDAFACGGGGRDGDLGAVAAVPRDEELMLLLLLRGAARSGRGRESVYLEGEGGRTCRDGSG